MPLPLPLGEDGEEGGNAVAASGGGEDAEVMLITPPGRAQ